MKEAHSIFIGDKVERALQIIEEESDSRYCGELQNKYADEEIEVSVELHGNYLNVEVDE